MGVYEVGTSARAKVFPAISGNIPMAGISLRAHERKSISGGFARPASVVVVKFGFYAERVTNDL